MKLVNKIGNVLRVKGRYAGNDLRGMLGLNDRFFKQARGARMLVYHGICEHDPTRFNSIFLTEKMFESHLQFFKENFKVVSLYDYYRQNFSYERFNVCLSFDDGFANNYKYVLPLLEKYQLPACFFITAIRDAGYDILWNDFLAVAQKKGPESWTFNGERFVKNKYGRYASQQHGKELRAILRATDFEKKAEMMRHLQQLVSFEAEKDYWLQMSTEEIRQLSLSPWATIGCHGYYHNDLAVLQEEAVKEELNRSKTFLEQVIDKPVNALAFPYGSYTKQVVDEAKRAGFTQLLAADLLDFMDTCLRERFTVNPYISLTNQMMSIVNGRYPG